MAVNLMLIVGACSMISGTCDVAVHSPDPAFETADQCREEAKNLSQDVDMLESILEVRAEDMPPPWKTKVFCGTPTQALEIDEYLHPRDEEKEGPQ